MDRKSVLRSLILEIRHGLEGGPDDDGNVVPGDLPRRLASIGVRTDRASVSVEELPHLSPEDRAARRVVDAFIEIRTAAGVSRADAVAEYVRGSAYSWANRLLALRCMEARGIVIDEVVLQKAAYGGRSLVHHRFAQRHPEQCGGEDEGLYAVLFAEFERQSRELPLLFDPRAADVALRPSTAAIRRCIALLSGTIAPQGQEAATDDAFVAPDVPGWAYQYWNVEEKDRVFERVSKVRGAKLEGRDIIPATCIYTEPYIVRFLVENSLGALWAGMHPESPLLKKWRYFVHGAERAPVAPHAVGDIAIIDPACGSGHFLVEAFDLLYDMYVEEGLVTDPAAICGLILERNLHGIDIDASAVQISALALYLKAKERAPEFRPRRVNLVATNVKLPAGKERIDAFLRKHPEDAPLRPALDAIFAGLEHADEVGALLPVENAVQRELDRIRAESEARRSDPKQQVLYAEVATPVQRTLPLDVPSPEAWRARTLDRLRDHFAGEARGDDLGAAFFGDAAGRGVGLVELLARRYDVVLANPPYMGSRNMGPTLKDFVKRHYDAGKRDLYAAFILRCTQLAADSGRVAMVTQQSWMFLGSFLDIRAVEEKEKKSSQRGFRGVLRDTTIETLAHLGPHAFSEVSGEVVSTVAFVLAKGAPQSDHRFTAFRLVGLKSPEAKDELLREAIAAGRLPTASKTSHKSISRPLQTRLLEIPQSPLCYWLRDRFFELLAGPTLGDVADVCQGLATADDARFVRFTWEVPLLEWGDPVRSRRWVPFEKGGGYGRWFGHHFWAVDWELEGARIRQTPGPRVQNDRHYFKTGWTYSVTAGGAVGFRVMEDAVFSAQSAGVIPTGKSAIGAVANARASSAAVRALTAQMYLRESYVGRLPQPVELPPDLHQFESACVAIKRLSVREDVLERTFEPQPVAGSSLTNAWVRHANAREAPEAWMLTLDAQIDQLVNDAMGLDRDDVAAVAAETGRASGSYALLSEHSAVPPVSIGDPASTAILGGLLLASTHAEATDAVRLAREALRELYMASSVGVSEHDNDGGDETSADEEAVPGTAGDQVPLPQECTLEVLADRLRIHPVSVYWLLCELREREAPTFNARIREFVAEHVAVLVLRAIGHRWPCDVELGAASPTWAARSGVVPVSQSGGDGTVVQRVRDALAAELGADRLTAIEHEFEQIVGASLVDWIGDGFLRWSIPRFRKRPIAWLLRSGIATGKAKTARTPMFACYVYFHGLDGDTLPSIRSEYVGPLRARFDVEHGTLDRLSMRTEEQDTRRAWLEAAIQELDDFDARLRQVIETGFASAAISDATAAEPLDRWTSRDGVAPAPETREAFVMQEGRYLPDVNDGVRVNIAPLQRAGLLAMDVLAKKDLDEAIADRARWRADERRWCREGKLRRPGWWAPTHGPGHLVDVS